MSTAADPTPEVTPSSGPADSNVSIKESKRPLELVGNGDVKISHDSPKQTKSEVPDVETTTDSTPEAPAESSYGPSKLEGVRIPFQRPVDSAKPTPAPKLTPDQQAKYDNLLKTASSWTEIPVSLAKQAPSEPITDAERMFMTRECLLRYLRATKWHTAEAAKRLLGTLSWRREYGVEKHTADYISVENETGKQVLIGYDIQGRPCLYLNPSKQNTEHSPRQIEHLVFMLERTIDLMGPGQETLCLLVNFKDTRSGQNATIGQGRQTLYILQNHYPERLGRSLVINVPFVIWGFFKLITPFIDPLTREKLIFNEDLKNHVPPDQLLKHCGGGVDFEYEHNLYWPALNKLASQRRKEYEERWVKGGKQVGEHEAYLKGGAEKSLSETTKQNVTPTTTTPADTASSPDQEIDEKVQMEATAAEEALKEETPDVTPLRVS